MNAKREQATTTPVHSAAIHDAVGAKALYDRASRLRMQGNVTDALPLYRQALERRPDFAECLNDLGLCLLLRKEFPEALTCLHRAVTLLPDNATAHRNLGGAMSHLDHFPEALAHLQASLRLDPTSADTAYRLAWWHYEAGILEGALDWASITLQLNPTHVQAHFLRAEILLHEGNYEAGWQEYEWRQPYRESPKFASLSSRRWHGESLEEKILLVFSDEGFGDCLQFARFLPFIAPRFGGRVVFFIPPKLARLLERSAKCDAVTTTVFLAAFDYAVPLLSLPLMLGVTEADIPTGGPYINPDPVLAAQWQERLASYPGLRVGLCWAGSPQQANDHRRSCTLADFAPLATVPGCTFFSLQKGPPAEQAHQPPPGLTLHDFTGDLHDFSDTAALISALDLVISVDTAVTHLAGAVGKPVWTLLSYIPNWRWRLNGETTPWYPSMRLFRRPQHGDWHSVMDRVAEALHRVITQVRQAQRHA